MGYLRAAIDEVRASVFNPIHPKDPGLAKLFGYGQVSSAGVHVDAESAQSIAAVWAAVRLLSRSVAALPLFVYRERKSGGKDRAKDHPLYPVLHSQPNEYQTSYDWRDGAQGFVSLRGNAYSQIVRDQGNRVLELVPIHTDYVRAGLLRDRLRYFVRPRGEGSEIPVDPEDMLHLRGPTSDGIMGVDPLTYASRSYGMSIAAEEYGAGLFRDGGMPIGVLSTKESLSDAAWTRLQKEVEKHGGLINANKKAILEEGLQWQEISFSPEQTQFLESRKFTVTQVAQWFGVPPHMIGDLERSTFNNIEHQAKEFVTYSLRPWLCSHEQRMEVALLSKKERETYSIRFSVDGLLRGDSKARSEFYRQLFGIGVFSQNDILELEDRNPVPGGDERYVPLNMIPSRLAPAFYAQEAQDPSDGSSGSGSGSDDPLSTDAKEGEAGLGDSVEPDLVLNGAQVQSLVQVVQAVHAGQLPYDSALEIIQSAFGMSQQKAEAVLGPRELVGSIAPDEAAARARRMIRMEVRATSKVRALPVEVRSQLADRFQPVFGSVVRSIVEREEVGLRAALAGASDVHHVLRGLGGFYGPGQGFRLQTRSAVAPVLHAVVSAIDPLASAEVGAEPLDEAGLIDWSTHLAESFQNRWAGRSRSDLKVVTKGFTEAPEAVIDQVLDGWRTTRAQAAAGDEIVKASRATARQAYTRAGRDRIRWVKRCAESPYCDVVADRVVAIRSAFLSEGDFVPIDGGEPLAIQHQIGHPPLRAGCVCDIAPA